MSTQISRNLVIMLAIGALRVPVLFGQNPPNPGQDIPLHPWSAPVFWDGSSLQDEKTGSAKVEATNTKSAVTGTPLTGTIALVGIVPCRLLDTRGATGETGAFGAPIMSAGQTRTIPVLSNTRCNIPATAQAYSLNFTVVPAGFLAYLSAWPTGNPPSPLVSILNDQSGAVLANAAVVPSGSGGSFDVFVTDQAHVIIDINGYYAPLPWLQAPNDASFNFSVGLFAMPAGGTGIQNTAIGDSALTANTSGSDNTGVGAGALHSNVGSQNTAVGSFSLFSNTTGPDNTALGRFALYGNTTGGNNTAVGEAALFTNKTGSYNTGLGKSALFYNTASNNTSVGWQALYNNSTGTPNTAVGWQALLSNTIGARNTALGSSALDGNTTAWDNTAVGDSALGSVQTGIQNTAVGSGALTNSTANYNTAVGYIALNSNTTGSFNAALGTYALSSNTTANYNTAIGYNALASSTGPYNTALGSVALIKNTTGNQNTALGYDALERNTTGGNNVAVGSTALSQNTTGAGNIALGTGAGANLTSGSNNVYISNNGVSSESGTIRIGAPGTQTTAFIAGIKGVTTGSNDGIPVVIDSNGQLGTVSSSRRFKEDIKDMAGASTGLLNLRPVTFRYARPYSNGSKPIDYGLIAEEVAEVYPDLVVRGPDGQVETVQYQKLTPMLLNELQKQQRQLQGAIEQLQDASDEIRELKRRLAAVEGSH